MNLGLWLKGYLPSRLLLWLIRFVAIGFVVLCGWVIYRYRGSEFFWHWIAIGTITLWFFDKLRTVERTLQGIHAELKAARLELADFNDRFRNAVTYGRQL